MPPALTDDDRAILAEVLRETIERDRYPMSPRIRSLKGNTGKARPHGSARAAGRLVQQEDRAAEAARLALAEHGHRRSPGA
jgi:hypothetical protein